MNKDLASGQRRIVCAAIRNASGDGGIICGVRHFDDIMRGKISASKADWRRPVQGFVDNQGHFLTREEAWTVAEQARQINTDRVQHPGRLFSEDLY